MTTKMKTTALAPWFGSNRMLAHAVGEELRGCKWVGIPFAGGMCEIPHIKASTIVVGDLHRHVINLARVVADDRLRSQLIDGLDRAAFHPDTLASKQEMAADILATWDSLSLDEHPFACVGAAEAYFVCCWMGRSGKAGTDGEFNGGLPVRWNANGGDSNTRYRSAVASLDAWGAIMRRCNFVIEDAFDFLDRVDDRPGHGVYVDPPFPNVGGEYRHKFTPADHRRLAGELAALRDVRVVCRFYDHPLIRELYPEQLYPGEMPNGWTWRRLVGRDQANAAKPEVLILNGPSYAEAAQ